MLFYIIEENLANKFSDTNRFLTTKTNNNNSKSTDWSQYLQILCAWELYF